MVADAEAAGFNPLTALRNGGAAGFSVTSQPVLSSTHQAIGEGLSGISNFIANFDPFEDQLREVQYQTMQAQLGNLQADTALKQKMMFDPPAVTARTKVASGPALGSGEIKPMYTQWRDRDGAVHWLPNPDLPDLDQMVVPAAGVLESSTHETYQRSREARAAARANAPATRDWTVGDVVSGVGTWWSSWRASNDRQWRAYQANRRP